MADCPDVSLFNHLPILTNLKYILHAIIIYFISAILKEGKCVKALSFFYFSFIAFQNLK